MFVRGEGGGGGGGGGFIDSQTSRSLDSLVQPEIYRLQVTGHRSQRIQTAQSSRLQTKN